MRRRARGAELDAAVVNAVLPWIASDTAVARISINVTTDSLLRAWCIDGWLAALTAWRVDPSRICIELPEHLPSPSNKPVRAAVERLSKAGMTIALDDVGIDGSLLRWCGTGLVDVLKLDRSVLQGDVESTRRQGAPTLLEGMSAFANAMGVELVVEGIEDASGARRVAALGSHVISQGYFIATPQRVINAVGSVLA